MSWKASAYIKQLVVCPNGERISRTEKLVALVLADSHQDKAQAKTFPAVKMIAEDSLMDPRVCRRILSSLERKGVIERDRAANQGRGQLTFYRFPALDEKEDTMSSFFSAKRRTEGGRKEDKTRISLYEEQEQKQKQVLPPLPPASQGEHVSTDRDAVESAVGQVMLGCGFTARRLLKMLAGVIGQEIAKDKTPDEAAKAMISAWRAYSVQDTGLRMKWRPTVFFAEGYWRDQRSWCWDAQELERKRVAREASVGSYRG